MRQKRYNKGVMKEYVTIIVGGGASGLFCAASLPHGNDALLLERGERVGRKLSATGNGQGNVTNLHMSAGHYFSLRGDPEGVLPRALSRHGERDMLAFFGNLGGVFLPDARGRVYPAGRQASAVTDLLRFAAAKNGVRTEAESRVISLKREGQGFTVGVQTPAGTKTYRARRVVLCAGGKAAKNFGTDGSAYALAEGLGHSVTPLYPSLVQIRTERSPIRGLKGIRAEAVLSARTEGGRKIAEERGDVIFTDYGVSGDAAFRLSAFVTERREKIFLSLAFLPDLPEEKIAAALRRKREAFPELPAGELLGGIVNNALGRAIARRCDPDDPDSAARALKNFTLAAEGTLGFDGAQVTKGGIPLAETDIDLQSRFAPGLYFAGEILDVDGECGGYNLQWAYSSARTVADAIGRAEAEEKR